MPRATLRRRRSGSSTSVRRRPCRSSEPRAAPPRSPPPAAPRPAPPPTPLGLTPPSPARLPRFGGLDRVMTIRDGVAARLLLVGESPVLVRAWRPDRRRVSIRAEAVDPGAVAIPAPGGVEIG